MIAFRKAHPALPPQTWSARAQPDRYCFNDACWHQALILRDVYLPRVCDPHHIGGAGSMARCGAAATLKPPGGSAMTNDTLVLAFAGVSRPNLQHGGARVTS